MQATSPNLTPGQPGTSTAAGPAWAPACVEDELLVAFGRVLRTFRTLLSDENLDPAVVAVLHELAARGPMRASLLADRVHLDLSTVSRHVRSLRHDGLVRRDGDPSDRRAALLSLTESGGVALHRAMHRRGTVLRQATADWPEADRASLTALLGRLADGLTARLLETR